MDKSTNNCIYPTIQVARFDCIDPHNILTQTKQALKFIKI